jgi:DNA-binding CsgD family transcriptional regulator
MPIPDSPRSEPPSSSSAAGPRSGAAVAAGDHDAEDAAALRRLVPLLALVLAFVVVAGVTDLILDRPSTWWSAHVLFELAVIGISLASAVLLWRGWWTTARELRRTREALAHTTRTLAERQAEREAWQRSAHAERASFGRAVDTQFAAWGLTPTEREVASLLLQGYGHKQIAARTGRSERTVRQHAVAVYGKSGIGGRAELAAFFLQDLLPASAGDGSAAS